MIAETVDIATSDGAADAFVARPDGDGPHPAVILYTDAFGIRPALEQHVKRLARNGYYVLAPNVFYRSRRAPVLDNLQELMASDGPVGAVRPAAAHDRTWSRRRRPMRS